MRATILTLSLTAVALAAAFTSSRAQATSPHVRIGTYDSRAVAIAFVASRFNPVSGKLRELEAAKAAGDERKVAELEAWGPRFQRALHRQGFGRVPVDDLLAHVEERLPDAARKAGVEAIVFASNWSAEGIEVVDVTGEVVALFEPSERTLATIAELSRLAPVDLDELDKDTQKH